MFPRQVSFKTFNCFERHQECLSRIPVKYLKWLGKKFAEPKRGLCLASLSPALRAELRQLRRNHPKFAHRCLSEHLDRIYADIFVVNMGFITIL